MNERWDVYSPSTGEKIYTMEETNISDLPIVIKTIEKKFYFLESVRYFRSVNLLYKITKCYYQSIR